MPRRKLTDAEKSALSVKMKAAWARRKRRAALGISGGAAVNKSGKSGVIVRASAVETMNMDDLVALRNTIDRELADRIVRGQTVE